MKIRYFFLIIIFFCNKNQAQDIGDDAKVVRYMVEKKFNQRKIKDLLKYGELQFTYNISYDKDNLIDNIIVNQKNEIFLDLGVRSDITIRFEMRSGEIHRIITHYHDLTVEFLRKKFNEIYSERKLDDVLFFTPNYKHYRYIYWDYDNNKASIAYVKYISSEHSKEFQELISRKQNIYEQNKK